MQNFKNEPQAIDVIDWYVKAEVRRRKRLSTRLSKTFFQTLFLNHAVLGVWTVEYRLRLACCSNKL
ncbi:MULTISPECIES: hypothetical protein [Nostocales]|uniref:Transposase n=3 Tax=Nostocales TaxID=1161 RepID=A0A8S9TGD0_9CYAN|nr:hypothetical protein [Tolypothrix bouteillei]KAF3890489.1 hypothetical protein DA73_0400037325 [Tolypothrix bouteillei VB521301]